MKRKTRGEPAKHPYEPAAWDLPDAVAIRSLAQGVASPDQQKRAITFIVNNMAGTYDLSYRPESDRDTTFAEGKRFVGLQIVKMTTLNLDALNPESSRDPSRK